VTKVPSLNYPDVVAALRRGGWRFVRQKGSHIRLELSTESGTLKITVPAHKPIKRSTLSKILSSAEMTLDAFLRLL